MWYVPPFEQGKVYWYLLFYCLFQSMQTVSTLPLVVLLMARVCTDDPGNAFSLFCSAFTCHTRLSPCSSARTRKRETPPLPIVSQRPSVIRIYFFTGATVVIAELPFCVSLRHDSGGFGNSSRHRNPGTDRRWRSWLPHGARCHRQRKRNQKYDNSSSGGNSECFAVCMSHGINSSGPSWRCLPVPRNKPTWLLQGSSASSTSSAPLCCISGWRSKKVWSYNTTRKLSLVYRHFQNCLVSSFRTVQQLVFK